MTVQRTICVKKYPCFKTWLLDTCKIILPHKFTNVIYLFIVKVEENSVIIAIVAMSKGEGYVPFCNPNQLWGDSIK